MDGRLFSATGTYHKRGEPSLRMLLTAVMSETESVAKICQEKAPDLSIEYIHSMMRKRSSKQS
jgi:hypothetical protein